MTNEEKQQIKATHLSVTGSVVFQRFIKVELMGLGFENVEYVDNRDVSQLKCQDKSIYAYDFVIGAGAIVVLDGNKFEYVERLKAAQYMAGYCAFWNVQGCEWLNLSIPMIIRGESSESAIKTAAHICARIAANIAVGRDVKHLPRFYLCKNLE